MTKKEEKYRSEHPNATPYEMLTEGVITQKRFDELNIMPEPQKPVMHEKEEKEMAKVKPTIVITNPIIPELTSFVQPSYGGRVHLKDKTTGKATLMSRGSAEREVKKYPNRYEII